MLTDPAGPFREQKAVRKTIARSPDMLQTRLPSELLLYRSLKQDSIVLCPSTITDTGALWPARDYASLGSIASWDFIFWLKASFCGISSQFHSAVTAET